MTSNKPDALAGARASEGSPGPASQRLHGLDALRCVAALMVMLFHYTTRYDQKFGHLTAPLFNAPRGYLGVNLFFMISGFVIFMTLERTSEPKDFLVSRFSRLYPAYWVAAILTFATEALAPELGKNISWAQALGNVLMFQNLVGIPSIDGVYWTLEVELLFYWAMLLIWLVGGFASPWRWIGTWLALSTVAGLAKVIGLPFPQIASRMLILPYFPYFALGCVLYIHFVRNSFRWPVEGVLGAFALLAIAINDPFIFVACTLGFLLLFYLVVRRYAMTRVVLFLAWIGIFSYPIYLVHETIGWTAIHWLEARGYNANLAIAGAAVTALTVAYLLHIAVERPVALAIRRHFKAARANKASTWDAASRKKWTAGVLAVGILVLIGNRLAPHL